MKKTIKLKCWPEYYQEVKNGNKTFEIRNNDRDYQVGDILLLQEWKPRGYCATMPSILEGDYTGDETEVKVTYIIKDKLLYIGIMSGYCIMSIKPVI